MILALETATPVCSVVLYNPNNGQIIQKRATGRGVHSTKMLVFVHELLAEMQATISDVSAIALSNGPGSFTGLRIATSAVKGLVFGRDVPILCFHTTYSIAAKALPLNLAGTVHGLVDARRTHLYHQKFFIEEGKITQLSQPKLYSIEELKSHHILGEDHLIGTGIDRLDLGENHSGYVSQNELDDISAAQLITLIKADSKEMGLNAYIAKLGINARELKILYSLD